MTISCFSHLECSQCNTIYEPSLENQLCSCGAPLLARYDMKKLGRATKSDLRGRVPSLWRYRFDISGDG